MEAITYLAVLSLSLNSGSGKPVAAVAVVGTWKVQLSQELRDVARKMGMSEPQSQFVFNTDRTFAYSASAGGTAKNANGTYEVSDHSVKLLAAKGGWPGGLVGELKDDHSLDVDGLKYVKADTQSVAGTWTLRNGLTEDRSTKMVFDKEGNFCFVSPSATSKGHFSVSGNSVTLTWTEIDGDKVEAGSVHKVVVLNDDGSLQIDTYKYGKG